MRLITIAFGLLFVFQLNLVKAQKAPIDVHGFDKTYELEKLLTPIDLQSDIFLIRRATSDDRYLYIFNDKESPVIKAYRLEDGQYMGGFGMVGEGPGEFNHFNPSSFNARSGQIVTQDLKYVRVFQRVESKGKLEFKQVIEVRMPTELDIVNQGFLLKDNLYAGSIMFTEKDFVTFPLTEMSNEARNNEVGDFGNYPQTYPEIPATAYHHLYQGMSSFAYDGDALVRYYSRVPLLRLFSLPSGKYYDIHLKPKHAQIKNLKPDSRNKSIQNGVEMVGYLSDIGLGRDLIVAEYQESTYRKVAMTERGNLEKVPLTDKFLLVFNRQGDLLAKLSPPEWLERFHVTPSNQLIVFHPEISDQLFVVDLNQFK